MPDDQFNEDAIGKIARYQRFVLVSLLLILIANAIVVMTMRTAGTGLSVLFAGIQLAAATFAAVSVFVLSKMLWGVGRAVLCVICVIIPIPLLGLITLVVVNQKATKVLTAHGLQVGLLGAKLPKDNK